MATDLERFVEAEGRDRLVQDVRARIDAEGIEYVYYQSVTITGRVVGKVMPARHLERAAVKGVQQHRTAVANLQSTREGSEQRAAEAAASERRRIARELHDIVAHSLSIVALQAAAAEQFVERDPARARTHLQLTRRTAQGALDEMRHLLEVLREDEASYAPQPGLSALPDLIVETEAALPPQVAERTEVMLLDGAGRIIATTRPDNLFRTFDLQAGERQRGSYYDGAGNIVAFARTLGYQEYDGLGWWGVIVQRTEQDQSIRDTIASVAARS